VELDVLKGDLAGDSLRSKASFVCRVDFGNTVDGFEELSSCSESLRDG